MGGSAALRRDVQSTGALLDNRRPLIVGRENYGGGRYYFEGEIADVIVTNAVLAGPPAGQPREPATFDGRTTWSERPPRLSTAIA